MPMPASCAMVAELTCAPQHSIDFAAAIAQEPATPALAEPNLIQLLVCEALSMKLSVAVLNRLLDRPGVETFSEGCIDVLRNQLGAERLSDLCKLDAYQIRALCDLAPDEKNYLVELCVRFQRELLTSCWSHPGLVPPSASPQHFLHQAFQAQQTPPSATSNVEHTQPRQPQSFHAQRATPQQELAVAPGCQSFQVQEMESTATPPTQSSNEVISSVSPGYTLWPEHEAKHIAGECKPCAYYFKPDSCKWGAKCDFCHLCPAGEIKTRKKEKIRTLREQALQEKDTKQTSQIMSVVSLSSALQI